MGSRLSAAALGVSLRDLEFDRLAASENPPVRDLFQQRVIHAAPILHQATEPGIGILHQRVEGGTHQVSVCAGAPAVVGWATGHLSEPPNNPQVGMANMRSIMPSLAKAKPAKAGADGVTFVKVALPKEKRETKVVKDAPVDEIARKVGYAEPSTLRRLIRRVLSEDRFRRRARELQKVMIGAGGASRGGTARR